MAMNKKEAQHLESTEHSLALARAMAWPNFDLPEPMTADRVKELQGDRGRGSHVVAWFVNTGYRQVTKGYTNGSNHCSDGKSSAYLSRDRGFCFETQKAALQWLRIHVTEECAAKLAAIDAELRACE